MFNLDLQDFLEQLGVGAIHNQLNALLEKGSCRSLSFPPVQVALFTRDIGQIENLRDCALDVMRGLVMTRVAPVSALITTERGFCTQQAPRVPPATMMKAVN